MSATPKYKHGERVQLQQEDFPVLCGEYTVMKVLWIESRARFEYVLSMEHQVADNDGVDFIITWSEEAIRKVHVPSEFINFAVLMKSIGGKADV